MGNAFFNKQHRDLVTHHMQRKENRAFLHCLLEFTQRHLSYTQGIKLLCKMCVLAHTCNLSTQETVRG